MFIENMSSFYVSELLPFNWYYLFLSISFMLNPPKGIERDRLASRKEIILRMMLYLGKVNGNLGAKIINLSFILALDRIYWAWYLIGH